jgi:hypothetical protein
MFSEGFAKGLRRWARATGGGALLLAALAPMAGATAIGSLPALPGACLDEHPGDGHTGQPYQGGDYDVVGGYPGMFQVYTADVEFAVFQGSMLGIPCPPGDYLYTYQFFNENGDEDTNPGAINTFDVGFDTGQSSTNQSSPGYLGRLYSIGEITDPNPAPGYSQPSSLPTAQVTPTSVLWNFDTASNQVNPGQESGILYFVTPDSPYWATGGVTGTAWETDVDIPVPEPASAGLMAAAGASLLLAHAARRAHRRK